MRYFLSKASRAVAECLAAQRTLCAFDYDGTLAPIVDHPEMARLRGSTRRLMARLARLYPCAVISGRSRADLLEKLRGAGVRRLIGNHGAETNLMSASEQRDVTEWQQALVPALAALPGVWVENKGQSLAVHYRQSTDKARARRRIATVVRNLERVRVIGGKQVVNLLSAGAPGKGAALAAERDRAGCNWILYVGDDENDEDAFTLAGNIVPVRIGRKPDSGAQFFLRNQREIDRLLALMIELRR